LDKVLGTPFDVALLSAHLSERSLPAVLPDSCSALQPHEHLPEQLRRLRPEMVTLVLNRRSYRRASISTVQMLSLTERLLRQREEAQRNRRLARCFRETLLPGPSLKIPGYEVACVYEPGGHSRLATSDSILRIVEDASAAGKIESRNPQSDGLGGDFYDLFLLPDGQIGVLIGDVSGRGVEVASLTAMARFYARAYAHQDPSPAQVIQLTNNALARDLPEERFVTLFYALLDPAARVFDWASAGHDPPLALPPRAGSPVSLEPTGLALGVMPGANYRERCLPLPEGAILLLYTDGITDPWERNGTTAPLARLLEAARDQSAAEVAARVLAAARAEAGGVLEDDVSLIVLRGVL
jgi:hypothetical protein